MVPDEIYLPYFTGRVLKRDEAKSDCLVIPMFAGVIAHCFLASLAFRKAAEADAGLASRARSVLDLAARAGSDDGFEMDVDSYAAVAGFMVSSWTRLETWCPSGHAGFLIRGYGVKLPNEMLPRSLAWLSGTPAPSITESVLVATFASTTFESKPSEIPPLSTKARKIRVVLADRLRRAQLNTWPKVLAATHADWTADTLACIAFHYALGSTGLVNHIRRRAAADRATDPKVSEETEPRSNSHQHQTMASTLEAEGAANRAAAMSLVEGAAAEITDLRAERDRWRRERELFAERHARAQSRIESLERELALAAAAKSDAEQRVALIEQERVLVGEQREVPTRSSGRSPQAPPLRLLTVWPDGACSLYRIAGCRRARCYCRTLPRLRGVARRLLLVG